MMILFFFYQEDALQLILEYRVYIQQNILISLAVLNLCYIVSSLLFLPGAIFSIITGFIFGTFMNGHILGYFLCIFAFLTFQAFSGLIVFNVSKLLIRNKIRKYFIEENENLKNLDKILSIYGTKALFFFRLSPLVPITLFNYISGGFNITNSMFFLSAYGSFPGELFHCYLGYSAANLGSMMDESQKKLVEIVMTVIGGIILLVLIFIFGRISKTQFNNLVEESERTAGSFKLELNNKDKKAQI